MPWKKTSRAFAPALLSLALTLLLASCVTSPPAKPAGPPPIAWPTLPPPPEGIALEADGACVLVPLDYWLELVGYVRRVDDVRAILEREGRLIP